MTEVNISPGSVSQKADIEAARHPRVEQFKETFRMLLRNKSGLVGMIIIVIYYIIAILDVVYPSYLGVAHDTTLSDFIPKSAGTIGAYSFIKPFAPGFSHGFGYILGGGTWNIPLLTTMLAAMKFDLGYSTLIVGVGAAVGITLGTVSAYLGGIMDEVMMRITDIFFSVPFIVLAVAITAILGHNYTALIYALIIIWWPIYARLSRSLALQTKSLNYIEAARAAGSSKTRNIFVHIIPNVLSPAFVQISLDIGTIILIFATLDFLGVLYINAFLGPPELGLLITLGVGGAGAPDYLMTGQWWIFLFPGLMLLLFTVSANLFGDGLRDVLDPKLRR
ncbi:MAG: ABC transporter permease [Thermoplasmataceae archaeon]|jgi:peptide/nickel transport system permease protein